MFTLIHPNALPCGELAHYFSYYCCVISQLAHFSHESYAKTQPSSDAYTRSRLNLCGRAAAKCEKTVEVGMRARGCGRKVPGRGKRSWSVSAPTSWRCSASVATFSKSIHEKQSHFLKSKIKFIEKLLGALLLLVLQVT